MKNCIIKVESKGLKPSEFVSRNPHCSVLVSEDDWDMEFIKVVNDSILSKSLQSSTEFAV